jgi:hypothetical protein
MLQRWSVGLTRPSRLSTERNRTSCAVVVHSSPPSPSRSPPSRCSRPAAAAAALRRPAQPGQPPRRPTLPGMRWRSRPACARTGCPAIQTHRCLNRRAACRSGSRRADSIPLPPRSSPPPTLVVTCCPTGDHRPVPAAPMSRYRTCATRPACARTESRTSPTPTTTESSPSPPGSTSKRRSSNVRRKRARTSSQVRSPSSTNLQAAPNAARTFSRRHRAGGEG